MSRTSSEDGSHWWASHSVVDLGACDEALLGRSFRKTKTLPFKSAEAVKHIPEELLQLMVKSSVFQWEQCDPWAELYILELFLPLFFVIFGECFGSLHN